MPDPSVAIVARGIGRTDLTATPLMRAAD